MCGIVGFTVRHQATHGEPSELNAHPHVGDDGNVVGVHNGIIENYQELKEKLLKKGYNYSKAADENELHVICCFDCVSA